MTACFCVLGAPSFVNFAVQCSSDLISVIGPGRES